MKIIRPRKFHEHTDYYREFESLDDSGAGYMFPCDAQGNLEPLNASAQINFARCTDGTYEVQDLGVTEWPRHWWDNAYGECVCGAEVELAGFTNTCWQCRRDYNSSGQLLAPRSQWGEETGESLSDILRIP